MKLDNMLTPKIKQFIIRNSVISAVSIWVIGAYLRDFLSDMIDYLIQPLFSVDLDKNGEPDLEQLAKMIFNVGPIKFPAGKMLYSIIKFVLELIFIYIIIYVAIHYTSIIKL